ncbi:LysR substrate-binding domain-containing protein [Pigmentiphaga soli]|uniref:LysR substrate-binding domain-containing protein n=1 Tax=Pigmentiphaga soli TaxID=1007095 RepID=A0ABP8GPF1_9BURK
MKIEAFAMLEAVLRYGTIAAAAREANLTASAVSVQMKQLESYLGQQLFDRSGLQVKPLPLAFEVSAVMQRARGELEALRRTTGPRVEGSLRLGVIESMQSLVLPGTLQLVRQRYPGLRVHPCRGRSADLTHAVKAGEIDGAIVAQPETGGSSRLRWHPVMRCPLSLVVPPAETETALPALFARHEWIRYDGRSIAGRAAARYLNARVRNKFGTLELDAVRAIMAMVSAGLGVSLVQLSEPGIRTAFPVRVLALPDAPVLRFVLVTRASDADSRPLAALREAVEETLAGAPAKA